MKKFPARPKKPVCAYFRYYDDVIEEVREKHPNSGKENDGHFYKSIIKEMFDKLDKDEKREKYIIPLRKEKLIWKKKIQAYEKKYRKKIKKMIGKKPKRPAHSYNMFMKNYKKKIQLENPNFNLYQVCKKIGELFKSKEKEKEVKELNKEFIKKMKIHKIKKKEYNDKLKQIIDSDSDCSDESSENSNISKNSDYEYKLKKRKKEKSKYSKKNSKKFLTNDVFRNQFNETKNFKEKIFKNQKKFDINNDEDDKKIFSDHEQIIDKKNKNNNLIKKENNFEDLKKKLIMKLENINLNDIQLKKITNLLKNDIEIENEKNFKTNKILQKKDFKDVSSSEKNRSESSEYKNSKENNSENSENL